MLIRRNSSFFRRCISIMKDMDKLPKKYKSFSDLQKGITMKPEAKVDTFCKTSELVYKPCEIYYKY